jgi:hypothetical protein
MSAPRLWYVATIEDGEVRYEAMWGRPEVDVDTPITRPWAILNDEFVIVNCGNGWGHGS